MAITSLSLPDQNSSVQDDLYCVVESDNVIQIDFKYVIDIYVLGRQLIRVKLYPDPSNNKAYFNFSNVVANEMKYNWFDPNGTVIMKELNSSGEINIPVDIKVGEEYSGLTTLNMDSGQVYVSNIIPNLNNRKISDTLDIFPNSIESKYLSNRPKYANTNYGENLHIGIINGYDDPYFSVAQYNSANALIGSIYRNNFSASALSNVFQLDIGPDALLNDGLTISQNCSYYLFTFYDNTTNEFIGNFKANMKCANKYDVINLHFINAYGVFDTARFDLVNKLMMDIENKSFETKDFRIDNNLYYYKQNNTDSYTNRIYNETKINFSKNINWTYKLTMDFPTDEEYIWLAELMMSPLIYAEIKISNNEKNYYPVTIKNTNYEYSNYVNNRLRPLEIEIELNQKRHGFRR